MVVILFGIYRLKVLEQQVVRESWVLKERSEELRIIYAWEDLLEVS